MPHDLLDRSGTAYVKMHEQEYQAEQELADRYRSFVTEVLRLSLGGLAVFSFIYKEGIPKDAGSLFALGPNDISALLGVAMFALSVVFALIFLYCASEGLRWYIAGLRSLSRLREGRTDERPAASSDENSPDDCLKERGKWISYCRWSKSLAAILLAAGGICMGLAIIPLDC